MNVLIDQKACGCANCGANNYVESSHGRTGITLRASGSTMATIIRLKITFPARKSRPPSAGSRDSAVTAEKVVSPAQKPGKSRWRSSVIPRRSIRTKRAVARATPIKLAASVPFRSFSITRPKAKRTRVPATPPIETKAKDFSSKSLSWKFHPGFES